MGSIQFLNDTGTFLLNDPEEVSGLYFPLAGEAGLKSAVSPSLAGDCKLDQETFLLEPVSIEDLHTSRSTRNFWCVSDKGCWSAAGVSARQEAERFTQAQDKSTLTAGLMWHSICRTSAFFRLRAEITSFVPPDENVEVMAVKLTNMDSAPQTVTAIGAVPIYGRSADNLRDHRNVTSMLHRIKTTTHGVLVKPTMSFDEKGHRENHRIYYVLGCAGDGTAPQAFYPTVEDFIGEGGTFLKPRAVYEDAPGVLAGTRIDGREAMGGIRFPAVTLGPGETARYTVLLGVSEDETEADRLCGALSTSKQVEAELERTKEYWQEKVNVRYRTGNERFDHLMRWVSFQPFLRRIYGCSFLPHHDYGRGGRGWRDLWQDCLSLLLMDPSGVGEMVKANFGGVRVDGTNATIIGDGLGNFIADRNGIARVWMDHALWPLMTVKLYIDQTGDYDILNAQAPYFKDPQAVRGTDIDGEWTQEYGNRQRSGSGMVYMGTVLEHLLIQHMAAFYEVGEHNIFRLRGADWNDALDMAPDRGESVAFTCAYAGNLRDLAALLRDLVERGQESAPLLEEIQELLAAEPGIYDNIQGKQAILDRYAQRCRHNVSGKTVELSLLPLADDLDGKADWLMAHIRAQEWISDGQDGWFNSYYDNSGRPLEGITENGARMMLTGQVFAVMSGVATEEQVRAITRSADRYLYKKEIGGYRLNTDFHELKFDMGRMFGFAYGEKENGAVFSHMAVMYANALYRRGFVREGYKALQALADAALNFGAGRIYPGIPEYFNDDGRGVYHYLTGAASWYMLTVITQAFGVRGERGNLVVDPKLVREQFDTSGIAAIDLPFAGREFRVTVANVSRREAGQYRVGKAYLLHPNSPQMVKLPVLDGKAVLRREEILRLPRQGNALTIELM